MEQPISFGDWVRRRRKALDLTQSTLAQQVGCALATVKKIEADERRPSREMAERLADCLRLPTEQRAGFLRAARAVLAIDDLADPTIPLGTPVPAQAADLATSGTITFLFTDIESSSQLWEQHRGAMSIALARHDAILRTAIGAQDGAVFKTVGDAFCVAFNDPRAALVAALEAQRELVAEPWGATGALRVRMAIHTGVADARGGDYFGPPLNRVARLLSVGHGRQVLLSAASAELLRDRLPPATTLRELGTHQLRDLSRPEQVFQASAPGLPDTFPPLRSLAARPNNLPAPPNVLIGREVELAAINRLLRQNDVRLVTLLGPGGTGKTRLALHVAYEQLDTYPDGVWFIDLTPIRDPALLMPTIAHALGLRESGDQPLAELLRGYLRPRLLLLVLDNFEQIVEAGSELNLLLSAAPHVRMLITSRTALRLSHEYLYDVPPLVVPLESSTDPLSTPAGQLFVVRARAARADFTVDAIGVAAIAAICRRLDGLPLAIELAAARVRLLPPQAILERLSHPLDLLIAGARDLPDRQQTLRATIAWSYELLSNAEQAAFRRLGVFVGGWTIEAAEAVVAEAQTLDLLAALVDKSLVWQAEGPEGVARFTMLETIREYALERLAEGEAAATGERHVDYYTALATRAAPLRHGSQQRAMMKHIEVEHENIRAALNWYGERNRYEQIIKLLNDVRWFQWKAGHGREGYAWAERVLREADAHTLAAPTRALALLCAGWFATSLGDHARGQHLLEEYLGAATPSHPNLGDALVCLNSLVYFQGDLARAHALNQQLLELGRQQGNLSLIANGLSYLADIACLQGDYESARRLGEESLATFRQRGGESGIATGSWLLGCIACEQGNYTRARALFEECRAQSEAIQDVEELGMGWLGLGLVALLETHYDEADGYLATALELHRSIGSSRAVAETLARLGSADLARGGYTRAQVCFADSLTLCKSIGYEIGIRWGLEGLAALCALAGPAERAARLLGATEMACESMGVALDAVQRTEHAWAMAAMQARLDPVSMAAAWAVGRALPLKRAIAYALDEEAPITSA